MSVVLSQNMTRTRISNLSAHGDKIPARKIWGVEEFGSWSKGIQSAMAGKHGCEVPAGNEGSGAKSSRTLPSCNSQSPPSGDPLLEDPSTFQDRISIWEPSVQT